MASNQEVAEVLAKLAVPGLGLSLNQLNLVQGIEIQHNVARITLASTGLSQARKDSLQARVEDRLKKLPDISKVELDFKEFKPAELNKIGHIIAVISGKGGVGKSLVTGLLAVSLSRRGYSAGILDADLTGPSIPRMFGITTRPEGTESAILPVLSRSGIAVMSLNLILHEEDEAVIWRGPIITSVIRQFREGVLWGNRDYLIVDLPPGTADAPLTVMQQFPLSGVVIVFTPQALTGMIVRKTVKMSQSMHKPILGLVENMSYLYIPEIKKRQEIFGASRAGQMVEAAKAPLWAQLPIDPELARLCDEGRIEDYSSEVVEKLGEGLLKSISDLAEKAAP